jgi:hypothetical protein
MSQHQPPYLGPESIANDTQDNECQEENNVDEEEHQGYFSKAIELERQLLDKNRDDPRPHRRQKPSFPLETTYRRSIRWSEALDTVL